MRARHTSVLRGALIAAAASCAGMTAAACGADWPVASSAPRGLVGEWASARESIAAGGSWQRTLTVRPDGRVVHRGVTYGLYPGQGPNDVSAETELHGRIGASERAFVIHADSVVTRDRFLGPDTRSVQRDTQRPAPSDSARYVVRGEELELTYLASPADAAVLTRELLRRRATR